MGEGGGRFGCLMKTGLEGKKKGKQRSSRRPNLVFRIAHSASGGHFSLLATKGAG